MYVYHQHGEGNHLTRSKDSKWSDDGQRLALQRGQLHVLYLQKLIGIHSFPPPNNKNPRTSFHTYCQIPPIKRWLLTTSFKKQQHHHHHRDKTIFHPPLLLVLSCGVGLPQRKKIPRRAKKKPRNPQELLQYSRPPLYLPRCFPLHFVPAPPVTDNHAR